MKDLLTKEESKELIEMDKTPPKLCPMASVIYCTKEQCTWWDENAEACAIMDIGFMLCSIAMELENIGKILKEKK